MTGARKITLRAVSDSHLSEKMEKIRVERLNFYYGQKLALSNISMSIQDRRITALIGPSGCGKSTFLRCINRMNDTIRGTRVEGCVEFGGQDIYSPGTDVVELRRRVGMVFQRPNPFPQSIFDNIAFGPRVLGLHADNGELYEIVERSLRSAVLWDEVKDILKANALSLSLGQQQRLCIARTIAVKPEVILMDEPCSALDPIATRQIEELVRSLKKITLSSLLPTTCSRLRALPITRACSGWANWSNSMQPRPSSPGRARNSPKTTSPAGRDKPRQAGCVRSRTTMES